MERGAGFQILVGFKAQRQGGVSRVGHGHRQRNQLGYVREVAHGDARIPSPHVHHGRPAAVVGRVHTEKVFLLEVDFQGQHPVRTISVRPALHRPEGGIGRAFGGRDGVVVVGPAGYVKRIGALVRVLHLEERHARKSVVDGDLHRLLHSARSPRNRYTAPGPELVAQALLPMAGNCEVLDRRAAGRN